MTKQKEQLFITKRKKEYTQTQAYPKISVDMETYKKLQECAWRANRSVSQVTKLMIDFAYDRTKFVEE